MRHTKRGLTDGDLKRIAAPAKGIRTVNAGGVPGLRYRVRANGRREFVFRYTAAGIATEVAIGVHSDRAPGMTAEKARRRAGELLADVRKGVYPASERREERAAALAARAEERAADQARAAASRGEATPGSFAALARLFLRDPSRANQREESRRAFVARVERELIPAWGARPAGDISRADVYALGTAIAAGEGRSRKRPGKPAPVAAANVIKLASTIFNFGLDVGFPGLVGNPCARVLRRIAPPRAGRDRQLSPAELRAFWTATEEQPPALRAFARLLLLTMLRRDELLGTRWSELEEDERGAWLAIPGERMKSGIAHLAALSTTAREELALLKEHRDTGQYLFPGRSAGKPMREVFYFRRRLQERMAILLADETVDPRPWTWHDLRRTARSLLAADGVSETVAELLLAHVPTAQRGSAGTYNRHSYAAERQIAIDALARRVKAIVSGELGKVVPFLQRG